MTRYSVEPRNLKRYVYLSFAKNMSKNLGENISKT